MDEASIARRLQEGNSIHQLCRSLATYQGFGTMGILGLLRRFTSLLLLACTSPAQSNFSLGVSPRSGVMSSIRPARARFSDRRKVLSRQLFANFVISIEKIVHICLKSLFCTPILQLARRFLLFETRGAGFNNERLSLEIAYALAIGWRRTLVLPPHCGNPV
eukprot:SAG31_NODE_785_length_12089_cov_4.342936_9_plen_162_part_00